MVPRGLPDLGQRDFAKTASADPSERVLHFDSRATERLLTLEGLRWPTRLSAGSCFAERLLTLAATGRQKGRPLLDFLVVADDAVLQGSAVPSLLPTPARG